MTDSAEDAPVQIIDHLPRADEEALSTFTVLQDNWYANKSIGRSKGHEWGLVCECNYRPGEWLFPARAVQPWLLYPEVDRD